MTKHKRFWLYDADFEFLGSHDELTEAEQAACKHSSEVTQETVMIHDSETKKEKRLTVFEPGFNRAPEWDEWKVNPLDKWMAEQAA